MLKWFTALLAIIICSAASAQAVNYECLDPIVEMRGIWVDAGAIPKTADGIRQMVRSYHKANLNVLFPEIIARGYTVYPSKLVARDPRFAGAIDPLPVMIDEAHKLGMEVHPWVWVFRAGYTKDRGAILTAHPDWAERGKDGRELSPNGGLWISSTNPQARDFLASLFAELAKNYDIDGLHLDYIRYEVESPTPYGYSESSRSLFDKEYGVDPQSIDRLSFNQLEWIRFRERQVNSFVQRIAEQTRAIRPNAKISAAVGSDPTTARLNLNQNWPNWVANRWVDFVTPMAYTNDDARFADLVTQEKDGADGKSIIGPGIGFFQQKDPQQMVRQIGITRKLGVCGQTLFAGSYFKNPQQSALVSGPYREPASLPFRDPAAKSVQLCKKAADLKHEGKPAEADYFSGLATTLAGYANYHQGAVPYVAPAAPPIKLPDSVVPLPTLDIPRTSKPVTIDGRLNEDAWRSAAVVNLSYMPQGEAAPVDTTAYLIYDDVNLYIGFKCAEPDIAKIKATVTKRDGPTFYDDSVEVFVDPTDKREDYYHLSTNTLGTRFDQKVFDASWDGNWTTASSVGSDSWTTEVAIPFAALGVATPTPGTQWALNLTRNRAASGVLQFITWAVPYGSFHSPDRFGKVVFGRWY